MRMFIFSIYHSFSRHLSKLYIITIANAFLMCYHHCASHNSCWKESILIERKSEQEMRQHRCCFTGHRPQKLTRPELDIQDELEAEIQSAIQSGYTTFITGMAYGVDIWAGEIVVRLRQDNPKIKLIATIPFPGFESRWSRDWKRRYLELLDKADLVRCISSGYRPSAYQARNEWMVDHASRVIAVYNGCSSGTKNTIDYARSKGIPVHIISA